MLIAPEIIDTHTRRFLQMLLDAGYIVTCIAKDNPMPEGHERFSYIKYPNIYISKRIRPQRFRRALAEWGIALRLRYIWQHVKPDVVHLLNINLQAYHCALAKLAPLVLTAVGSDINDRFETGNDDAERRKKIAKALSAACHITADTREVLERCEILANRPLDSSLFYFGINLKLFTPRSVDETLAMRKKMSIALESKVVLSPRRLTPKMKHDVVLKAFSEHIKKSNLDAVLIFRRFSLYDMPFENTLRNLATDLGVTDKVIWVEEMDYLQIPILYSLADLIINIPEQDGLPVTLFEASACMTPVLTSNLSSYQEFLSDGAYYRVGVGDINGVVAVLERVLVESDEGLSEKLQKNYNLIVDKADQEKCFPVIDQIYQRLR
jgi:glycosyltransferase involved in cell wall biosynthesis